MCLLQSLCVCLLQSLCEFVCVFIVEFVCVSLDIAKEIQLKIVWVIRVASIKTSW